MARAFAMLSVASAIADDSVHLLQMQAQRHDHHHVHHNQKMDIEGEGIRPMETPCNAIDGKSAEYLDRHNVLCRGNEAIVSFGMTRQGCSGGNQHISYACQTVNITGNSRMANTPCNELYEKEIQYLDRQDVSCAPGEALQTYGVTRNGCSNSGMKYSLTCVKIAGYGSTRTAYTPCNRFIGKELAYLDRHACVCNSGEHLEGFQVQTGCPSGDDRRYMFKCGMTTTTTTTTTTTEPYDCRTRELWPSEKYAYCCTDKGIGCTTTTTTTTTTTVTTTVDDASAQDDPHLSDMAGDKFDLYNAGRQEFVVIPAGASAKDADLFVTGVVEKYGHRKNDLWIRSLSVKGKWVGEDYSFKTNSAAFGDAATVQVRSGKNHKWLPLEGLKDPKLIVTSKDKQAPATDFAESVAKTVELKAGPLKVVVSYATAQKDGEKVNHLDLHVKNLHSVKSDVGGLLAGEVSA